MWTLIDPAGETTSFSELLPAGLGPIGTATYSLAIPTGEGSPTGMFKSSLK